MKALRGIIGVILLIVGAIVTSASFYTIAEYEQVVITQFGKPVGDAITDAGPHFRTPFLQEVNRFEKRMLEWDGEANEIPTADKRFIWVDTTARWRIADPLLFLQTVRTTNGAQGRLDDIIDSATRDHISANNLVESVRPSNRVLDVKRDDGEENLLGSSEDMERVEIGRDEVARRILASAQTLALEYGIEIVDVRIKRLKYRDDVREAVYARMISERNRIAERYRSEGQGRKAEILGRREKEAKRISSEAERAALEIVARADAEAARIYSDAYRADEEFYAFWRSLEAYRTIIGDNHTLVLSPNSELYRFLVSPGTE